MGDTYTVELRAAYGADNGATASKKFTPALEGVGAIPSSTLTGTTDCLGYTDFPGGNSDRLVGSQVTGDDPAKSAFDILAKGTDPNTGGLYYFAEYYFNDAADDEVRTGWFSQACFEPVSGHIANSIPKTWPPVEGEWSFKASIDPNPLDSGTKTGATLTFSATYTVTSGKQFLAEDVDAESKDDDPLKVSLANSGLIQIGATFTDNNDGGKIGYGTEQGSLKEASTVASLAADQCVKDFTKGTITCRWSVLPMNNFVFAKANTTPGTYAIPLQLATETTFTVTASTSGDNGVADFPSAVAVVGTSRLFEAQLEVTPGPPGAPTGLSAEGAHSRVSLTWTDPDNRTITAYQYRQTTTSDVKLTWADPGDDTITKWQYRETTVTIGDPPTGDFMNVGWIDIPDSHKDTTTYTVAGANPDTTFFEVRPFRALVADTTLTLTATPSVTLSWAAPDVGVETITKYQYRHSTDGTFQADGLDWTNFPSSDASTMTFTPTIVDLGTANYWEIRPYTTEGKDAVSLTKDASVELRWTDPSDPDIDGYEFRDGADRAWTVITTSTDGTNVTHTISAVDLGVSHAYEVRSFKQDVEGAAVDPLTKAGVGNYAGAGWKDINGVYATTTSHIVTGLDNGETYYFQIWAGNISGLKGALRYGPESEDASAATMAGPPVKPTGLVATPNGEVKNNEVILTWENPGDATSYVYRQTTSIQAVLTWTADDTATGWKYQQSVDGGTTFGEPMDLVVDDPSTANTATITVANAYLDNGYQVLPVYGSVDQDPVDTQQTISGVFPDGPPLGWMPIVPSNAETTEYKVTGLDLANNSYAFEVQKVGGDGATVDVTQHHLGSVTLSWDDPGDPTITRYEVRYTDESQGGNPKYPDPAVWTKLDYEGPVDGRLTGDVEDLSATRYKQDFAATDHTYYGFQIRAVNLDASKAEQNGLKSDSSNEANPGPPPPVPTGLTATYDPENGEISVTWDEYAHASWAGNANFQVEWENTRDSDVAGRSGADAPKPYTHNTAGSYGDYRLRIRARSEFSPWSDWSDWEEVTATAFLEGPGATREVDENAGIGANVGKPFEVLMPTGIDVSLSLSKVTGLFDIDRDGQITMTGDVSRRAYPAKVNATFREAEYPYTQVGVDSLDLIITVTSQGQWRQYAKLTADDGVEGDRLGDSLAYDPATGTIVSGAPEVGDSAGAVYVFEGPGYTTPVKLTPLTATSGEKFGITVAIDGDVVAVGTACECANDKVYVFVKPNSGWATTSTPDATLSVAANTEHVWFGDGLAVSGEHIVVGAVDAGASSAGEVYVFKEPDTGWTNATAPDAILTASDFQEGRYLGWKLAVNGDDIVVGDVRHDAVYVFTKTGDTWTTGTETAKVIPLDQDDRRAFGISVDIEGDTMVVGDSEYLIRDGAVQDKPGVAYVFTRSGDKWTQVAKLTGVGLDAGDAFGYASALSGDTIAIGQVLPADNYDSGAVQVYEKKGGRWSPSIVPYVLRSSDPPAPQAMGHSVVLDGDLLIAGATLADGKGALFVFRKIPQVVDSEGNMVPSPGLVDLGRSDEEVRVSSPNGRVTVTIPENGRSEDYLLSVDSSAGDCAGDPRPEAPGLELRLCGDVNFYDLDGTAADGDITVDATLNINLGFPNTNNFRVFKRSRPGQPWVEIPNCGDTSAPNAECYNPDPDRRKFINIGGINSFSQRAVMGPPLVRPPGAPGNLVAEAGNRQVKLTWTAPSTTGGSAITGYEYSTDDGRNWNSMPGSDRSTTSYTVTNLSNGITYQCAVSARNSAGLGARSNIVEARPRSRGRDVPPGRARGGSATAHVPPTFDEGASTTRRIAENSPTGTRIGGPLVARDPLERRVLYTKGGPDADLFDVASQTGQIFVRRGAMLDYESGRRTYLIEVVGNTGVGGPGKIAVTIIVTNVPEPGSVVLSPDTPPEVGAEITAALSDPDGGINGVSWQWQRSSDGRTWNDIPGATSASYTPTEADRGMMLRASVSYNDAAATGINLVSMATGAVPERTPVLDLPGSVTLSPEGAPEVGTEITATLTDPDGGVTGETWQWQRSADGVTWTAIDGASAASYTPAEADVGMMLRANVSYSDAAAAGVSLVGATTEAVAEMPAPDRPGSVTLSPEGTPEIGKAITATVTDPDGEVTGEIWQWQRSADGVTWTDIDGATTERYTPTEADAGMMLRANVSYNDAVATGVNAMGMNTEAVAASPAPDLETPTPTPTPPSPPVRPATPTPTPTPTLVVPPQTSTPTQTMLPTPPPTDVPPTPTAITSEVTPTEAPTTPVTPEEEGGFPAWLIIVIIIGAVIIIAGIIIIVRSRMQQ